MLWLSAGAPAAGSLTPAKRTTVIPAQHYSGACNPGKRPDTRKMVFASRTGSRDIVRDRYLCIAV